MGYYDQTPNGRRQRPKRGRTFLAGLGGVLVGALLIWLLFSARPELLPGNSSQTAQNQQETVESSEQGQTEQRSVEVTNDVTEAVDIANDTVVGVTNLQAASDFFSESPSQAVGTGSGVIYKNDNGTAYVVTNHHVVNGATDIEVTMPDGGKKEATLVGSDVWTDLAVLSMDSEGIDNVAQFGDSDVLKQGETVIAIGNPLGLDFYGSVTTGVVSGTDRAVPVDIDGDNVVDWEVEVLQTDAAINPGNSGGALINISGQLIGINSMKINPATAEGIGFAIPINTAIPIIESLESDGQMVRPAMGITLLDLDQVPQMYREETLNLPAEVEGGVVVNSVLPDSGAAEAGLQQYDVIVEMDGIPIDGSIALRKHLYEEKEIGEMLQVKAYRDGELLEFEFELVENSSLQ
ncbi:S1C family serine protease [Planococcus sp. CAU13]|uniref:S1C family serine protease n=1 Tax=Planococcus sp. CAU13 TaxID=1541197 RepID=UPI00052FE5CC|nr:trypsin-like peptidase domain-containing protein [Planococcus sp. CAU13]